MALRDLVGNAQVRDALDVAGGAVLAASLGASLIGCAILLPHLARILLSGT